MKVFKKFLFNACLYTVIILTIFYLFAAVSELSDSVIGVSKYFTILVFGALISASVLVFDTKIKKAYKYLINYAVLLAAFCTIFLSASSGVGNFVARVFASVVIFTLIYAFVFLFRYLFSILWQKMPKRRK